MDAMKFIARLARILPVYGVMDNKCYSDLHCLTVAVGLQFASKSLDIQNCKPTPLASLKQC